MPKSDTARKSKKKKRSSLSARNADHHALYQSSVQEPEADTRFMHESSAEYEEQVGRDVAKRALCRENGVRLLEVGHGVPDAELVLHLMELLF